MKMNKNHNNIGSKIFSTVKRQNLSQPKAKVMKKQLKDKNYLVF